MASAASSLTFLRHLPSALFLCVPSRSNRGGIQTPNARPAAMSALPIGLLLGRCLKVASRLWVRALFTALAVLLPVLASQAHAATSSASLIGAGSPFARTYVQKAYVAYYGRPADPGGQDFWASRMDAEGGRLDSIIADFGTSDEFNRRYGGLTPEQLITKIYQQALNRGPDPGGLAFYLGELQAGRKTPQTLTLNVLDGATTAPDSTTVDNKLAVADYYTSSVAAGCDYAGEQVGVDTLTPVTSDAATVAAAKAAIDLRCTGGKTVNPAAMEDAYPLNELTFELPNLIGRKVWVMGFYGNTQNNGDGVGFLVDNPLRLEVDEVFPHHSFSRLDGNLPPDDWQGSEVLVYGTVKDYAQTYGVPAVQPTPLVTIIQIQRMRLAVRTNSWENTFLLDTPPAPAVAPVAALRAADGRVSAAAATGTKAQDCDRSVIIAGAVDASSNHARFKENVILKFNKMKELGFTDAQIKVFYHDGSAIAVNGTNVVDDKATKQKIKDHFIALAGEMTGSCTLTLFVTGHGTGYSPEQGYSGARPALSGEDATGGMLYAENTFEIDAREKRVVPSFELNGNVYSALLTGAADIVLFKRSRGEWKFLGTDANGDNIISETEASGEDFNDDGDVTDTDVGLQGAELFKRQGNVRYRTNQWDTDGDGVVDVRLRHDGVSFVIERLDAGTWKEMGRDTNGDFMIDATDGGVDWNLDGDKNDQIGFHEGINLLGTEVLWDDEFADMLRPLSDKGIHVLVEMVTSFSGGIVPQLEGLVETIYAGASEDTKHYNRTDAAGKVYAADEKAFLENLQGIDPDSWTAAGFAAIDADNAAADAEGSPKNIYTLLLTKYYASTSRFRAEGNGEYTVELDIPKELFAQVWDFEFILGLQKPRWSSVGFPQNLPAGLLALPIAGGVSVFGNRPIPDTTQVRIKVDGAVVTDSIRIEYSDFARQRLGYTLAVPGTLSGSVTLGPPTVCIDHNNPNFPFNNGSIELLFPWIPTDFVSKPSDISVAMLVSAPGQNTTVLSARNNGFYLYFARGIDDLAGPYYYEIFLARNLQTGQGLPFSGVIEGPLNVPPGELNPDGCNPPK